MESMMTSLWKIPWWIRIAQIIRENHMESDSQAADHQIAIVAVVWKKLRMRYQDINTEENRLLREAHRTYWRTYRIWAMMKFIMLCGQELNNRNRRLLRTNHPHSILFKTMVHLLHLIHSDLKIVKLNKSKEELLLRQVLWNQITHHKYTKLGVEDHQWQIHHNLVKHNKAVLNKENLLGIQESK